ncbi:hypothetical protein BRC82_01240 [Halobacteriales archaeon QS_1_67_19]|nr:MAG: hypothetical protein BRC82_01240 [Halobacteriales archaeon QS_1_67_19]
MGRYPREVRDARMKCIECNAPVVETLEGTYACVNCGSEPVQSRTDASAATPNDPTAAADD